MDWTIGPLDPWTIGLFFGLFLGPFFGPFFEPFFFGPFYRGGGRPLVLREGWDASHHYSGRGGRRTVVTKGGVEYELSVRSEGWEVVVLVTATD